MTAQLLPRAGSKELVGTIRLLLWSNWNGADLDDDGHSSVIAKLTDGTVVKGPCSANGIEVGMAYRFLGYWVQHHQYGSQFLFSTFCRSEPASCNGLVRYLVKLAPHIGPARAEKLWERFGAEAVATLRTAPKQVADAGILPFDQAQEAAAVLQAAADLEQTKIELFNLLGGRGFPGQLFNAVISRWGAQAPARIRRDPYILLTTKPKLPGCGFKRCDKLYRSLKYPLHRLKRQMLCGWHTVREDANGHTWLAFGCVAEAIRKAADNADPEKAIQLGIRAKWLAKHVDGHGQRWLAETKRARNEKVIADKLTELLATPPRWSTAADEIQVGDGSLSEHQRQTLALALQRSVGILAGTPGTGKTYTTGQLVKYLACSFGLDSIAVCAPTGKAAVRCTYALYQYGLDLDATTVHRLLGVTRNGHDDQGWGFQHNESYPVAKSFILIDECSMLDTDLTAALLTACAPGTHVLFIGDPYQLPPVGHGAPLRDMLAAGIPCGELSEIRRNAGMIVKACARIKDGQRFEAEQGNEWEADVVKTGDYDGGFNLQHYETMDPDESIERLLALFTAIRQACEFDPIWDVQVLVAVNSKSDVSRNALNKLLQSQLNPTGLSARGNPFRAGDKLICLRNHWATAVQLVVGRKGRIVPDYDALPDAVMVANGDIGRVVAVSPGVAIARFNAPDRLIRVTVANSKNEDDLSEESAGCGFDLAYAVTTHKMQGSEAPVAIVMIDGSPGAKWIYSREHLYTSISRAQRLCITIGQWSVMMRMSKRVSLSRRKTFLKEQVVSQQKEGAK